MVRIGEQGGVPGGNNDNSNKPQLPKLPNRELDQIGERLRNGNINKFIPGNFRTKQNGALTPDRVVERGDQNRIVQITTGFDENGDKKLEGDEIETKFVHLSDIEVNGKRLEDVQHEYENGKIKTSRQGFDDNNNGVIDPEEQTSITHWEDLDLP